MNKLIRINPNDNVAVATENIEKGYCECGVTAIDDIPFGHKILLQSVKKGENIIKYGCPIGHATVDIKAGSFVHEHNIKTNLSDKLTYKFCGNNEYKPQKSNVTIKAYKRSNGKIGVRNEIWIIPTVGCVNKTAQALEKIGNSMNYDSCDGVVAFTHPFGCSQMGDDLVNTQKILSALVKHPNAGGVLVLSLGCENNNLSVFKSFLGDVDESRVKFLCVQDVEDELESGTELLHEIYSVIKNDKREDAPIDKLTVGWKCGGSDAFSGITANALCGRANDKLTSLGASTVLTEVPEMFGAEHLLMARAENEAVFNKTVSMINSFKDYFSSHNQVCYENPSPGNHAGGITTLEEKSLGCIQKGGRSVITDVLQYGAQAEKKGLNLLWGPGNDIVSTTALTAAGAHIILFTTGRGTSLGAPVPTIKISSNTRLFDKKRNWIDFNAGALIEGKHFDELTKDLLNLIINTAGGQKTKNEINGYRDISIFKDGVIM